MDTSSQTIRIWNNMGIAMKKGAKWGDIAVYTREEMDEVLAARRPNVPKSKPKPVVCMEQVIIERAAPSGYILVESVAPTSAPFLPAKKQTLRAKLDKFLTPSVRALCLGCGTYCVHSKPPDSWSASDRKRYCCIGCRDSSGKKHADRCQKHKPI